MGACTSRDAIGNITSLSFQTGWASTSGDGDDDDEYNDDDEVDDDDDDDDGGDDDDHQNNKLVMKFWDKGKV